MRPLAGAVTPTRALDVGIGAPRSVTTRRGGLSRSGSTARLLRPPRREPRRRAAPLCSRPESIPTVRLTNAAQAGAVAVLFYGADLPAGGIGLDESAPIPAVSVPEDVAHTLLATIRARHPGDRVARRRAGPSRTAGEGKSHALLVDRAGVRRPRETRGRGARASRSRPPSRERTPTARLVTARSTGRVLLRRSSPEPPRCLRRRAPISTPML